MEGTRALFGFYMYAQYKYHHNATLSYMGDALHRFPTFKDVCLLRRACKEANAQGNALRTEVVKTRKVDKKTNVDTRTLSKTWHEMNHRRKFLRHEIDGSKELDADFNFVKVHLISHWVEQIRQHGALHHYSAKRHEHPHNTNLKDSWNGSNHNLNCLPQVITFQHHILCLEIRELNIQAIAQHQEISAAVCKVLPSAADMAALCASSNRRNQNALDHKTAVM
jgi:hypothetical protein